MYLRRKIDDYLLAWRNREDKLPLIVKVQGRLAKQKSIFHFAQKIMKTL